MKIKGIIEEDFLQYKKPSLFINTCFCNFKCDKENGNQICQNSSLPYEPDIEANDDNLIERYLDNSITKSIVFGGLEPFIQFNELVVFIDKLRNKYKCEDDIVVYTGYKEEEIKEKVEYLKVFKNIIIKFGRFIPNQEKHLDEVLGIYLASDNQYAVKIS